jgi:hypothetical protein
MPRRVPPAEALPQRPAKRAGAMLPGADNPKLAGQVRKLLGKHYAAKYGKRRGG